MSKRILIDAFHQEETRLVILEGDKLKELECEPAVHRSAKGNIYLARVSRVEPSLQAAFLDLGDGRQGFLAFNEIHPDYYRIPVEDQKALLNSLAEEEASDEDALEERDDPVSEVQKTRIDRNILKKYKIQEVVRKHQLMLVRIVKDERGGKKAALTTYLSFPGRYCVLMPNTPKGGGISRKITDTKQRTRLKKVLADLNIPEGMGVILRTAGIDRTKTEIKRDFDYLIKLWESIREKTLNSTAPICIYKEIDLAGRAIRDFYTKDVDEVLVEGEETYKGVRTLMRQLIPSHVKRVKLYHDPEQPLFMKYGVEGQIQDIYNPVVTLPSGGYLVIHPTEALTSIDVNSGRATRERHIEETALKTNLEAASEVARQLHLRDLAGLIVIDFIDMSSERHNIQVERKFREALKEDRARTKVGSISMFGLLEMSRQRIRRGFTDFMDVVCSTCHGGGRVRSTGSLSLQLFRTLEKEVLSKQGNEIYVELHPDLAMHILNEKRRYLVDFESRHQTRVIFLPNNLLGLGDFRFLDEAPSTTKEVKETVSKRSRTSKKETQERKIVSKESVESVQPSAEKDKPEGKVIPMPITSTKGSKKTKASNKRRRDNVQETPLKEKAELVSIVPEPEKEPEAPEPIVPDTKLKAKSTAQRFGHRQKLKSKPGLAAAKSHQKADEMEDVAPDSEKSTNKEETASPKKNRKKKGWWQKLLE
jgi:ribonuclease E